MLINFELQQCLSAFWYVFLQSKIKKCRWGSILARKHFSCSSYCQKLVKCFLLYKRCLLTQSKRDGMKKISPFLACIIPSKTKWNAYEVKAERFSYTMIKTTFTFDYDKPLINLHLKTLSSKISQNAFVNVMDLSFWRFSTVASWQIKFYISFRL